MPQFFEELFSFLYGATSDAGPPADDLIRFDGMNFVLRLGHLTNFFTPKIGRKLSPRDELELRASKASIFLQ